MNAIQNELLGVAKSALEFEKRWPIHLPAYGVVVASSLFYTWLWYRPRSFVGLLPKGSDPCKVMALISNILKFAQFSLIGMAVDWKNVAARLVDPIVKRSDPVALTLAALALLFFFLGQHLNYFVMLRLKLDGVYYGVRFGKSIPWVSSYPYNVRWLRDPQYLGGILSCLGVAIAAPKIADICFFWILNYLYLVWLENKVPTGSAAAVSAGGEEKRVTRSKTAAAGKKD